MPYLTCPNCGSTLNVPSAEASPEACPSCCARLHPSDAIAWQRPPPRPEASDRPRLRLALAADPKAPAAARHALGVLGSDVHEDVLARARLLVSELVTNVVLHAGPVFGSRAEMSVWLSPGRLRVEIKDNGPGFRPAARALDQDLGSGWGLHVIDSLADDWGVAVADGACVWFDLAARGEDRSEPDVATAERASVATA